MGTTFCWVRSWIWLFCKQAVAGWGAGRVFHWAGGRERDPFAAGDTLLLGSVRGSVKLQLRCCNYGVGSSGTYTTPSFALVEVAVWPRAGLGLVPLPAASDSDGGSPCHVPLCGSANTGLAQCLRAAQRKESRGSLHPLGGLTLWMDSGYAGHSLLVIQRAAASLRSAQRHQGREAEAEVVFVPLAETHRWGLPPSTENSRTS